MIPLVHLLSFSVSIEIYTNIDGIDISYKRVACMQKCVCVLVAELREEEVMPEGPRGFGLNTKQQLSSIMADEGIVQLQICTLRHQLVSPNKSMLMRAICTTQGNPRQPTTKYKGHSKQCSHDHVPPPRNRTGGGKDGLPPSFVETCIEPCQLVHQVFGLKEVGGK